MRTYTTKTKLVLTSVMTMLVLSLTLIGATFVSAAKPTNSVAVDLDQCRNGALGDPQADVEQCVTTGSGSTGWVNGNAGASNAHFAEGESISYRARLSGLPVSGQNTAQVVLIMGYDVIHNGHDAIDYLTDKNRWQAPETDVATTPDIPCSGISPAPAGCAEPPVGGTPSLIAIDPPETNIQVDKTKTLANGCQTNGTGATQQPLTSFNALPAAQRQMELFGGTNGDFSYLAPTPTLLDKNGDQEQQVRVTFTATSANPVLAWGGHITSRLDWGCDGSIRSASGISGSPYHMRIKSAIVNGTPVSLGNQDRSLSASAVVFFNPGITTTLSATTGLVGASIHDGATLSDATADAGGSATYRIYTDDTCTTLATTGTTGEIDAQPAAVTVTNGVVPDSADVVFQQAGTYYWQVSYSGDGHNASATSACQSEIVTISKTSPTASTAQSLVPNDTFTLSGAAGTPSGTVDFYLFAPGVACSEANEANALQTLTGMSPSLSSGSATTTNTTAVTVEGTYTWLAVWAGDTANTKTVSNCVETFTIDNDTTAP
jgi:hypothetical protein